MSPRLVGGSRRFQDLLRILGDQHVEIPERVRPAQEGGGVGLGPEVSGGYCRQGLGRGQLQHLAPFRRASFVVRENPTGNAQPTRSTRGREKLQEPAPTVTHAPSRIATKASVIVT